MDEKLKMQEREFALFEVWDIVSKIEQSEKPSIEKIPILIKYAQEFYGRLEFDLAQKELWGWTWNAEDQKWEQEKRSIPNFIVETKRAYDKYEFQKALENMDTVFSYYKERYDNFISIYKPFYDLVFKLLGEVSTSLKFVKEGSEERKKLAEAEQRAEEISAMLTEKENEIARLNEALDSIEERLEESLFNMKNYQAWIDLFSKDPIFKNKENVRIVSYVLARKEAVSSEVASRLGMSDINARTSLKDLHFRGVLNATKRGTTYVYTANKKFPEEKNQETKLDKDKSFFENMKEKVSQFKKSEELKGAEENGENSSGEESAKQESLQLPDSSE